ncbi:MAG TPA: tyrosine--tRNA ligase, partial [Gaiellaceae bacterium]|nr:tyrosine--tRNA ligase [Gaiellaceae bacterium]
MIEALTRNAVDVLPAGGLEEKLKLGRPLRVKLGIDPTSPDVHLGFAFVLDRLAAFQAAGHTVVLIVGDYTARIGDPSGRSKERPVLADEELDANAHRFAEQAFRVLDAERTEIRFNSEWLSKLDFAEILRLTRTTTVAQILERDDFAKRMAANAPISVSELLYPLMQAYDSVAVRADVELGGTDQLYNILMGREVMAAYGIEPQIAVTVRYLDSWDGLGMSASRGNYIGLREDAEEQFGKTMRIPDSLLRQWYELLVERDVPDGDAMDSKLALARWIVARSHGKDAAEEAEAHFTQVVRAGRAPDEVPEAPLPPGDPVHLPAALAAAFGLSTSEVRRLIAGGGVKVDGEVVRALDLDRAALSEATVQAGKRRFVRFR